MNKFKYLMNNEFFSLFAPDTGDGGSGAGENGSGAGENGSSAGDGRTSFSGTLIEKKDPVSGLMVKLPKELDSYLGHVISHTRNSTENKYKPLLEKLESDTAEFAEVKSELQKMKEMNMSLEERAAENYKRKQAEYEGKIKNLTEESSSWKTRFEHAMINNDILSSFGDVKLCNAEQTALLLRNEGKAEVVNILDSYGKPTDEFETRVSVFLTNEKTKEMEKVEGSPRDIFKKWINEDRNLHHQLNNLTPGGGSNGGNRGKYSGKDWMSMSAEERLRRAREE